MDLMIFKWCVLAPAALAVVGSLACQSTCGVIRSANDSPVTFQNAAIPSMESAIIALSWWFAICIGIYSSGTLSLWPEDAWPKIVWSTLAAAVLVSPQFMPMSASSSREKAGSDRPGLWVLVGVIAIAAASLAMPNGDGWSDMLPLHQTWIAAVAMSTIFNTWALYRMARRNAERWLPLVLLAGLACPMLIGAAAYSALAQACLAAIAATSVIAIFAVAGRLHVTAALILPCALFTTTMIAAGRFYSYAEISPVDYGIALFAPSIIALIDRIITHQSTIIRVVVAATVGSCLVGFIAYRFLLS